mmetsp:Transcript_142770/g.355878  ORF Transcript_142770/g.355878 Transcript_142770/m.355878 type:complete len:366 (+) Transcript_142770:235-1332(+)
MEETVLLADRLPDDHPVQDDARLRPQHLVRGVGRKRSRDELEESLDERLEVVPVVWQKQWQHILVVVGAGKLTVRQQHGHHRGAVALHVCAVHGLGDDKELLQAAQGAAREEDEDAPGLADGAADRGEILKRVVAQVAGQRHAHLEKLVRDLAEEYAGGGEGLLVVLLDRYEEHVLLIRNRLEVLRERGLPLRQAGHDEVQPRTAEDVRRRLDDPSLAVQEPSEALLNVMPNQAILGHARDVDVGLHGVNLPVLRRLEGVRPDRRHAHFARLEGRGDLAGAPRARQGVAREVHDELLHVRLHDVEQAVEVLQVVGVDEDAAVVQRLQAHLEEPSLSGCAGLVVADEVVVEGRPPEVVVGGDEQSA